MGGKVTKKKMTLRIIVGMLTIILIVTGILPFMTNKTLAAENVLSDNIILVTENEVSDTAKDGYSKVTFKIGDQTKDVYIKNGNTVKLKSSNKNYGVIAGGIENGEYMPNRILIREHYILKNLYKVKHQTKMVTIHFSFLQNRRIFHQ